MTNKICICIPLYKETPDAIDKFSLKQLEKIVSDKYDKYIICPDGFNYSKYKKLLTIKDVVFFDKDYFKSNMTYSQLCVNYDFYNTFNMYDYMLIYQTDCLIFKDELEKYADMGYDYIGAPIISSYSYWPHFNRSNKPIIGNGGFSLRKISTFIEICDENSELHKEIAKVIDFSKIFVEDRFYCDELSHVYDIDKPSWRIGAKFSFDINADYLYEYCKIDLPMGCHAYDKNIRFWQQHIKITKTVIDACEKKNEAMFKEYYNKDNKSYNIKTVNK